MCGISGYLDLDHGVKPSVLHRMNDVIIHRGPDDEGYALIGPDGPVFFRGKDTMEDIRLPSLEQADGRGTFLGFGHRRLSILDLSVSGHQPMYFPDRDVTVTYNGEIYNFIELREELKALGYTFRTSCDTEILLYAYCQWGEDCLSHFNGMWGFALWDGIARKLFCARDRLGAKPFHYWHHGNKLLFGSELKQLCQDDDVPRHFDLSYLAANMIYGLADFNDQTLIDGMHALPAGHKLIVQISDDLRQIVSVQDEPYWTLTCEYQEGISAGEWKERVADEFSRACRWRLRSDAPVTALLSGGLDSSCLVTEVCEQLDDPSSFETFTNSYPGRADCDEWEYADILNQALGCKGHKIMPDPQEDIEGLYEKALWHAEGIGNLGMLGHIRLVQEVKQCGYKVVLNGQCGDETMFGYTWYYVYYLYDLLRKGKIYDMVKTYRELSQHSPHSAGALIVSGLYFNIPAARHLLKTSKARSWVSPELMRQPIWPIMKSNLYHKSFQEFYLKGLTRISLPNIVRYDDRLYMSASLESRLPFMDYQFVELASHIPPELKIQNGYTKNIMRKAFDGRMPDSITWRTSKLGFNAPEDRWASRFSKEYLADRVDHAKIAPYVNCNHLKHLVEKDPTSPELFQFLQLEVFARNFDVN